MNIISKLKQKVIKVPWKKFYHKKDLKIKVEDISIYEMFRRSAIENQELTAIDYYGKTITYKTFLEQVDKAAKALKSQGIRPMDVVTICMPNTPEAIVSFYAINKIGAIANMIHPLSGEEEIKEYLTSTHSVMLIMIDICYEKVKNIINRTDVYKTIVISAKDSMPFLISLGYQLTQGYKVKRPKKTEAYIYWKDFLK